MEVPVGDFKFNPLAKKYIADIIRTGRLSYGDYHRRFEKSFAELHDSRHGVFCNSGTSALHIALQALKEKYGWNDYDEVIVPAVTFVATANIVLHNRMTPVFVDVHPETYNINPELLERAIGSKTRAIIPVHLTGLPADMYPIMDIANRRNLRVIEDSCEAVGATYNGIKVGAMGDIGCFSTYMAHYIVTGVGGMCTTRDPDLAIRLRSLMNHGRDSIYLNIDDDNKVTEEIIERRFRFTSSGHSFRCTELEAAIGLSQIPGIETAIATRKKIAATYTKELAGISQLQLPIASDRAEHVYMMYPILLNGPSKKDFTAHLESAGIETRDLLPLLNQPVYKAMFGDIEAGFPVARKINRHGLYIGCHQYLTFSQVRHVVETIKRFFR